MFNFTIVMGVFYVHIDIKHINIYLLSIIEFLTSLHFNLKIKTHQQVACNQFENKKKIHH